jgi:predicted DNA-binding ribbon-helix-helix protein
MIKKRSINIHGHQTSISLEPEFWDALKSLADNKKLSLNKMIALIDDERSPENNLSSAIRIYILKSLTGTNL